jgi:hypothetical protein
MKSWGEFIMSRGLWAFIVMWSIGLPSAWAVFAQGDDLRKNAKVGEIETPAIDEGVRKEALEPGRKPYPPSEADNIDPSFGGNRTITLRQPELRATLTSIPAGTGIPGDVMMRIEAVDPHGPFQDRYKVKDLVPKSELEQAQLDANQ